MATVATRRSNRGVSPASPAGEGPSDLGRDEVLCAAATAFIARGYDGASIDEIADELKSIQGRI